MRKTLYTIALLTIVTGAWAQDLNPTVEVTNTYKREASGIEKPSQLLPLPDSISRFNYDFDYTVRSTPYRGSYEFKPYNVALKPAPRPSTESSLYGRIGAGYGFHPLASLVWTPVTGEKMHVNVYGSYQGYLGFYRDIRFDAASAMFTDSGTKTDGWRDRSGKVGGDIRLDWRNSSLWTAVRYKSIAGSDAWSSVTTRGADADAAFSGRTPRMVYDLSTHLSVLGNTAMDELHTLTDAYVGFPIGRTRAGIKAMAQTLNYADASVNGFAGNFGITPSCLFSLGKLKVDAGVKVAFILRSDSSLCPGKGGIVFPDVHLTYPVVDDGLVLLASATGGNTINSFDRSLEANHFLGSFSFTPDISRETINLNAGARGNIRERFHFNAKAGFKRQVNALSWGYSTPGTGYLPIVGYMSPLNTFYAGSELGFKSDHIDIDGNVCYQYTLTPKINTAIQANLFGPPAFKADCSAMYRFFGGRWKAGVTVDAMSERHSENASLPGYVDLGLHTQFEMNRYWGVWLTVGNLLNQSVQKIPFHAERGIWFSIGASMNI